MNLSILDEVVPFALMLFVKSTVVLLLAFVASWMLRRKSAAVRHVVWSIAIATTALLPLASVLPSWRVAILSPAMSPQAPAIAPSHSLDVPAPHVPGDTVKSSYPSPPTVDILPAAADSSHDGLRINPATVMSSFSVSEKVGLSLAAVWALGFVCCVLHTIAGLVMVERLRRRSTPANGEVGSIAEEARRTAGIARVSFAASAFVDVPMTWGLFHPMVLLPARSGISLKTWSDECVRAALLHELAHVRRRDWALMLLGRMVCAAYWFQPLAWIAMSRSRAESERACDDLVLAMGVRPSDYAERLVEVVRSIPVGSRPSLAAIAMAQPSELEGRLRDVLDRGRDRRAVGVRAASAIVIAAMAVTVPIFLVQPVAADRRSTGRPIVRGIIKFIDFKKVSTDGSTGYSIRATRDRGGHSVYTIVDSENHFTFQDAPTIVAEFQKVIDAGWKRRPGATLYDVPANLRTPAFAEAVYFSPAQREKAILLAKQMDAWVALMIESPTIATDADIEPNAMARLGGGGSPTLDIRLTAEGGRKMYEFTSRHIRRTMGILVDGRLFSAPVIMSAIRDEGQIGGFSSLAEASRLAKRLNGSAPRAVVSARHFYFADSKGKFVELLADDTTSVPVLYGSSATFPNGYKLQIGNVTQVYSDIPPAQVKDGPAPFEYSVPYGLIPPGGLSNPTDVSVYREVLGASDLTGRVAFDRINDHGGNGRMNAYLPPDAKSFSMRFGIADGPWKSEANLPISAVSGTHTGPSGWDIAIKLDDKPAIMGNDGSDHVSRVTYFLGKDGSLPNVARRVVAVDEAGHETVIRASQRGMGGVPMCNLSYSKTSLWAHINSTIDLQSVRAFKLEVRPFQIVEVRDIPLTSDLRVGVDVSSWDRPYRQKVCLENMKTIGMAMVWYEQEHDMRFPAMDGIDAMRRDLQPYIHKLAEPNPLTSTPMLFEGPDPFTSPVTDKPLVPAAEWSQKSIAALTTPSTTVVLRDGSVSGPDGRKWACELFADGHARLMEVK